MVYKHCRCGCGGIIGQYSKAKEVIIREVKKVRDDSYRFYSDNNIEIVRC